MWSWLTRWLRSGSAAEKAEAEGRVDEAARLYVEAGERAEALRVLLRAGETARTLEERRGFYVRAYGLARTKEQKNDAEHGLAMVTLAEGETHTVRTEEDRRRLEEAAGVLEAAGSFREAARAYGLLDDRDAVVRVLTLAGDVEGLERETERTEEVERVGLRRRKAVEEFEVLWQGGDRGRALEILTRWVTTHGDDHETRRLLDAHAARSLKGAMCDMVLGGVRWTLVWRFPVVLGREGDVVLRGGSVSRRHARLLKTDGGFALEDAESRAGIALDGVPAAGSVPLLDGHTVSLGGDLALRVGAEGPHTTLEVDRGMDRGRRLLLVAGPWETPFGAVAFGPLGPELSPREPVYLNGRRVALAVTLASGDLVEQGEHSLRVGADGAPKGQ
ncbi:MAG: FHA domain-containing protein [Deltaproteobacteria bacterium]|nr:FHA domain-containing protein [Deltaproteobacteria bacterium]